MKKSLFFSPIVLGLIALQAKAQISDVSVVVAPTLGYNWFDNKSTIENGLMYGIQAGFSFGKVVELKGIFERSSNLKQNFGQYEDDIKVVIPGFGGFQDRNIRVTRIGGEFKTNIPVGSFSPYILLGTGIQSFEREMTNNSTYKNENLYGSAGLGFKVNMGKRVTLNLEGRGLVYNMDPTSLLYNPGGSNDFDNWINSQNNNRMYNWSATAGLQFYLGGTDNSNLTEMEKAYYRRFSSGMKGIKVTLAPEGAYMDFNRNSPFRNTYLLGGKLGIDFTDYVGINAYYYQATADQNPSFNFDKMSMFGADFVGRLNVPRGIVPYITIGGGMINVQDGYNGKRIGNILPPVYQTAASTYYAKGGLGLEIPLGKYVGVYGGANLIYTLDNQNTDITNINSTNQLQQSTMYNVGIKLKLGKNARTEYAVNQDYSQRFEASRIAYNQKIKSLEKELKEAYEKNDLEKMNKIVGEKKQIEIEQQKIETQQNTESTVLPTEQQYIKMTPAELNELIDKVIKGVETNDTESVEKRIERLEILLNRNNVNPQSTSYIAEPATLTDNKAINDKLLAEIERLNGTINSQNKTIDTLKAKAIPSKEQGIIVKPLIPATENTEPKSSNLDGLGIYLGPSFDGNTNFNIGIRSFTTFNNTKILFMPEAYVALGKGTTGFGVSANAIIPILNKYTNNFSPYLGVGVGLNYANENFHFNPNFIAGTGYKLGKGNLFADYTVRGNFKYNQLALGYRFVL
ncbi:MAG TPA: hypothetical protein PKX92_07005 [Edaphocola sp.]|nr:hypothetical protein [Edaphocola sp.]